MKASFPFHWTAATVLAAAFGAGPAQLAAQPAPPKNLQVFPADIEPQQLFAAMRRISAGLGVQCNFCHTPPDFASDENHHKEVARKMLRMVMHVREQQADYLPDGAAAKVNYWTCHRGETH
ncbi:MAG: c-type cytochrome, partial [Planctomycetota bacterium]